MYVTNVLLVMTLSPNGICKMLVFKQCLQFKLGGYLTSKWHSVNAHHYLLSKHTYACLVVSAEVWHLILVMCNLELDQS